MKLERLSIQGFKSFKDRTTILFDRGGITGIVGPNGCGKSNIVDALFWVMGEQSARHLRGEKMSDLIFNGTDKYNPASFAEVTLTLKNINNKHIHINNKVVRPSEIELTRKLYRNGETEYRTNGLLARLKDIQEVFMDTGAGAKSYSVIAQGEIERLVRAKPEERRHMIDEVAGITKFKLRRKESLKKLELTQVNLDRLTDLKTEVQKQLKNLEEQAEKAKKARHLKEKMIHHDLIVQSHKELEFVERFLKYDEKIQTNELEIEKCKIELTKNEVLGEEDQLKKLDLMEKVDSEQAEFNTLSIQVATVEERANILEKSLVGIDQNIKQKSEEVQGLDKDLISRGEKLRNITKEYEELTSKGFTEVDTTMLDDELEELKSSTLEQEQEYNSWKQKKQSLQKEFSILEQEEFKLKSKIEEIGQSLHEISEETETLESQSGSALSDIGHLRSKLHEIKSEHIITSELAQEVQQIIQEKKATQKELDLVVKNLSKEVVTVESQINALEKIKFNSLQKKGAQKYINQDVEHAEKFALLGHVIDCPSEYAKAVQKMFGAELEALVISDGDSFNSVLNFAKKDSQNLDGIILAANVQNTNSYNLESYIESAIKVSTVVQLKNHQHLLGLENANIFAGKYIVEDLEAIGDLEKLRELDFVSIVSQDGTLLVEKYEDKILIDCQFEKGDQSANGLLERENLVKNLVINLNEKKEVYETSEVELHKTVQDLEDQLFKLENIKIREQNLKNEIVHLEADIRSQENGAQSGEVRLEILKKKKSELSSRRLDLLEDEDKFREKFDSIQAELKNIEQLILEKEEALHELKQSYEDKRDIVLEMKAGAKNFDYQSKSLLSQKADLEEQLSKMHNRHTQLIQQISELKLELENSNVTVLQFRDQAKALLKELKEKERTLSVLKDELEALLEELEDSSGEVRKIQSKLLQLEKEVAEARVKREQVVIEEASLVKENFEAHKVDLRQIISQYLELPIEKVAGLSDIDYLFSIEQNGELVALAKEHYEFNRKIPSLVKESSEKFRRYKYELNGIGEVNWFADKDYERQKIRFEFLNDQENELKQSMQDLHNAINLIDQKSIERFKIAYHEVNDRFSKVFPIIFGGGKANLDLVGNLNDPDCGIEINAQPPGKKMQSINLMSGGEKALTALSLIFSIFLVRPSPFCLLDEVDAPLDDANVGRFNELLREMGTETQFILITHNKKTMELNDVLYGVTMQEPGVSKALSVQLH